MMMAEVIMRNKVFPKVVLAVIILLTVLFLMMSRGSQDVTSEEIKAAIKLDIPANNIEDDITEKKDETKDTKKEGEPKKAFSESDTENALVDLASVASMKQRVKNTFKPREIPVRKSQVKYIRPEKPATVRKYWQVVQDKDKSSMETYLYSAHYDDRKSIEYPTIRVIAILDRAAKTYYCLLWFKQNPTPDIVEADRIKAGQWYLRHGKRFQAEILSCGVANSQNDLPIYVSIVGDLKTQPTTSLPIQIPERPSAPIDFGVCLGIGYGLIEPAKIVEWMELMKQWGVAEVNMYNHSLSEESGVIFNHYSNEGFVDFRQAPSVMNDEGEETILLNMSPVLNDCMYRNLYRYRVLIATDMDELIAPHDAENYYEMMASLAKKHPSKHPATSYMFRNAYFFMELPPSPGPEYLITQRYTYRVKPEKFGVSGKSITSPQSCVVLQSHMCWKVVPLYDTPGWLMNVDTSIGLNHHYKYCHLDDVHNREGLCSNITATIYRDERMLHFADGLIERATEIMFKLNLEDAFLGGEQEQNVPAPRDVDRT